ncbi:MAG: hypothetical protein NZ750_11255 [Anaerolineae bacterium]|nr:hypothetical protein [Anaerolineae bacterium]MDW8172065.1 hypothetical protein [Anaerolineae bacterium]
MPERLLLALLALSLSLPLAQGQQPTVTPTLPPQIVWQVFVNRNLDGAGTARLIFLNSLTGAQISQEVRGERFTPFGAGVLYFDPLTRRVMWLEPERQPVPHAFVSLPDDALRVDWIVDEVQTRIAWTVTRPNAEGLVTTTEIARRDGTERGVVLRDGPRQGIRALPIAFSADYGQLFMDAQPDGLAPFVAYEQFAGLFRVFLDDGRVEALPNEPSCYCGAGFRGDLYLRLALTTDQRGFDLRFYDLQRGTEGRVLANRLLNYTQAGEILISPDGRFAVYALTRVENFGTARQEVETVFMLADLVNSSQRPLSNPITTYVHPIAWTDDNSAILLTSPQQDGTWKLQLADGHLRRVASATLIGWLRP